MMMGRRRLSPLRPLLARCRRASGTSAPDAYNHAAVEAKWQQRWDDSGLHRASRREGREKKYVLDMFPYPSGEGLHVGHVLGYTATDVMARYWRMQGYDVLHPMGRFCCFGLDVLLREDGYDPSPSSSSSSSSPCADPATPGNTPILSSWLRAPFRVNPFSPPLPSRLGRVRAPRGAARS